MESVKRFIDDSLRLTVNERKSAVDRPWKRKFLGFTAVPVGCDDGLPQGVQLIGARFREDLLLDVAQAVEDRVPVFTPIEPRAAREQAFTDRTQRIPGE